MNRAILGSVTAVALLLAAASASAGSVSKACLSDPASCLGAATETATEADTDDVVEALCGKSADQCGGTKSATTKKARGGKKGIGKKLKEIEDASDSD